MDAREIFPHRLRVARREAGLTQMQLAEAIGADNVQISRYESGTIVPSVDTLVKVAEALECSIDYLLGRSDLRLIGALSSTDLELDEQLFIQALRESDFMKVLSLLALYAPPKPGRDAVTYFDARQRQRRMRESRVRQNRAWYEAHRDRLSEEAGAIDPIASDDQDAKTD